MAGDRSLIEGGGREAVEVFDSMKERLTSLESTLSDTSDAVSKVTGDFEKLFALGSESRGLKQIRGQTEAFSQLSDNIGNVSKVVSGLSEGLASLSGKIPGVGNLLSGVFQTMALGTDIIGMIGTETIAAGQAVLQGLDAPSHAIRQYDATIFELGKTMGGTIGESQDFMDSLNAETASQFARAMYLTKDEMIDFLKATDNTSLSLDQLNQTVDTGIGTTTLYAAAAATAAAMGLRMGAAADLINVAMNKQGKSAQDAMEMMGMFSGVAGEIGLKAKTVATTLNSAVAGFEKLGLSADFGRPILEGFGRVMNDMGLGIENATELTNTLSKALAGLTTDYANAYLIFQRGGLDIGGGGGSGVLGASIGMQAAMLDAEKTGDQSKIGAQLLGGLRDTLASFTGGNIVTVGQAAESPELQNQFYVQQQMLKTQFGVGDDASATRILDLLASLDEATRTGDTSAKESLEAQLSNEMDGRDETLGEWEKANRELALQSNLLAIIARAPAMQLREFGAGIRENVLNPAIQQGGEMARNATASVGGFMKETLGNLPEDHPVRKFLEGQTTGSSGVTMTAPTTGWEQAATGSGFGAGGTGKHSMDIGQVMGARAGAATTPYRSMTAGEDPEEYAEAKASNMASRERDVRRAAQFVAQNTDQSSTTFTSPELADAIVKAWRETGGATTVVHIDLTPEAGAIVNTIKEIKTDLEGAGAGTDGGSL